MPRCMTTCSHMICPFCTGKTKIYNSRGTQSHTQTWRRHQCQTCSKAFTTKERVDWTGQVQVRSSEHTLPYSREQLLLSLARASTNLTLPAGTISDLTDTIELELQNNQFFSQGTQEADVITQISTTVIHRYDPNLALQYVNQVYSNKPPLELLKRLIAT